MIRNDEIQAALVAYLKSKAVITSLVTNSKSVIEVREDQWAGVDFEYPAIRVRLISNNPLAGVDCHQRIEVSFMAFSESDSSLQADQIAGIINNALHEKQFKSNSIAFALRTTNLIPAVRSDIRTWRAEVLMSGIVSG